ncbi:MAG: tetratricopeptide repeat protein [Terriglobales bacterium]
MDRVAFAQFMNRPAVVIASLTVLAVIGFAGVTRLSNRFGEQQKALARHLYQQGLADQQAGKPEMAVEHFRAALTYSHDNFQYQLSLARALRDTGRIPEAETYLISLWERSPQDGAVNLALGRLAAREKLLDKTTQYYHNAIYGVWPSNADENRLNAWFELVDFLLHQNARPQAQAELIALSAELPRRPELQLRVADFFARAQDYPHALLEYQKVLQTSRGNPEALAGAGEAAFNLARYRTAARYLEAAVTANPRDTDSAQLLQVTKVVLDVNPFGREISSSERHRRIRAIFEAGGKRLDACLATPVPSSLPATGAPALPVSPLKTSWLEMKKKLARLGPRGESGLADEVMDLVQQIEQETPNCSTTPQDQALLLLAQNRAGVEQ